MKLSIIVPVYNVEKYLCKCIDSILAQTFTDFELIIVDDGSTDGSPALCDGYINKDQRVRVIHKKNGGLSDARNAGLDIAVGDYIGFVDSDDYIEPKMYEELFKLSAEKNADITDCNFTRVDEHGNDVSPKKCLRYDSDMCVLCKDMVENFFSSEYTHTDVVCTKLFRRELFSDIRFPKGMIYEDSYVILDLIAKGKIFAATQKSYYNYLQRSDSIIHRKFSSKNFDILHTYFKRLDFFESNGLTLMYNRMLDIFIKQYCQFRFLVYIEDKSLKKPFKSFSKRAFKLIIDVCKSTELCKLKKITYITVFFSPRFAYKICNKYFPEMLGLSWDEWKEKNKK